MPEGLEVLNEDGTVRNSITTFFGKILGQQNVSTGLLVVATMNWPYPDVPVNQRVVYCISNRSWVDNQNSTAWALFTDATRSVIQYSQDIDRAAITLLFMQY